MGLNTAGLAFHKSRSLGLGNRPLSTGGGAQQAVECLPRRAVVLAEPYGFMCSIHLITRQALLGGPVVGQAI
jgi:hypothetical protein